ncbi:acetyl-CoA carboxylase biotin carboxylase subunit [Heliorestis convoluta]|uniref:biotin carboxylase n=1 Tax=Heliorestis convoluta TaxID=356322 RepID=A0A5Q2MXV2_9FIRM|nr:acetyl-CoA carboxylase biotin carboxylase subunit [Heliorestis convoluta]QGG47427.1 acetyl-CoA carboxylase biotin carboxylase subunit [Heliorestis convoluta]
MFNKVLIANRGEIALRLLRAAQALQIRTVLVYSEADQDTLPVKEADEAYLIGPPPVAQSYLQVEKILEVAKKTGAQAIHPGYGLLSENATFARRCAEEGIKFIGPSASIIAIMGDKVAARRTMAAAGVPVVPGTERAPEDLQAALVEANRIGYPIMVKAAAGGGGIGMQIAHDESALAAAWESCAHRGGRFFGDRTLFLERYFSRSRHIEVQLMADEHGNAIHLFERDCSIQRRHQKIVEEAPAAQLSLELREKMGQVALKAARAIGYSNVGTMEFLVDEDDNFYFLEMNTRLQVEHPVTEMVTNIDIAQAQYRIAAGEKLWLQQEDVALQGHAIEVRLYAENPDNFLPSPGRINHFYIPQKENVRVDGWVQSGTVVTPYYDPLLAKIIAHGENRAEAIAMLQATLQETEIEGIKTNLPVLKDILAHHTFQAGEGNCYFVREMLGKAV